MARRLGRRRRDLSPTLRRIAQIARAHDQGATHQGQCPSSLPEEGSPALIVTHLPGTTQTELRLGCRLGPVTSAGAAADEVLVRPVGAYSESSAEKLAPPRLVGGFVGAPRRASVLILKSAASDGGL